MRLIDADAFKEYLKNAFEEVKHVYTDGGVFAWRITEDFCRDIDEQPTINAEPEPSQVASDIATIIENEQDMRVLLSQPEIIRCKDCRNREVCRTSTVWAVAPDDDWYCADAKRRTDGVDS